MNTTIRRIALGCALMLALTPLCAGAETSLSANGGFGDGVSMQARTQMGRYNVDRSQLTDQQKQVYDKALADYAAIEDQALAELVEAGDVLQEAVERFTQTRDSQGMMASLEMDKWTGEQQQAFQSAMSAQGDERASAFAALVSSGQLTKAQADALSSMNGLFAGRRQDAGAAGELPPWNGQDMSAFPGDGEFPLPDDIGDGQDAVRQGGNIDIWTQLQNQERTQSIQKALETIQGAQQLFSESLSEAGIQMMN